MFNYVMRLVGGDRALAEDLTQEVFIRVFQGLPKFSLRSKFTTWLFQVTKNRVLDELRDQARREAALVLEEAHAEARKITREALAERERLGTETHRIKALLGAALDAVEDADGEARAEAA